MYKETQILTPLGYYINNLSKLAIHVGVPRPLPRLGVPLPHLLPRPLPHPALRRVGGAASGGGWRR